MSEGAPQVSQATIDALPKIQSTEGPAPTESPITSATPEKAHKEGILSKLRHLLGNESKMTGPGTGNDMSPNKNVVQGSAEHTAYTAGLDKIAANARAEADKPAHAGYGPEAQAARREEVMQSGLNVAAKAPESMSSVTPDLTPVAEALQNTAVSEEADTDPHDFSTKQGVDDALANITKSLAEQGTSDSSSDEGKDTKTGFASKLAGVGAVGLVGVGALGGGVAAASEAPTQDAPPAQEHVVDMPSSESTIISAADGSSASVNIDTQNPANSMISVTPTEGKVTQEVTSSSRSESLNLTGADGGQIEDSAISATEKTMMQEAIVAMENHAELRDQLVVVKDVDGKVGLFTKDGRSVTKNDAGEMVISDTATASFEGSTLVANMGWKMKQTDTLETTSYPPEGAVGPVETATPEKYQGGMFEVTMPDGSKVQSCAVDNPSMIADSVSYTFKDKDGNVLNTYGSLAEAQSSDYVAGGSIEQSLVPKAGCEALAEQSVIAVHDASVSEGFDPNVEQLLLTSGGVAEVVKDENGTAHYISKVTLPEKGMPGENGEAVCSPYVQVDGIIGKALDSVGWKGGFYSFSKAYGDVRLISAGENRLALVCTPKEIPPTVSVDEQEKTDQLAVPLIVLFKAPEITTPPTPPQEVTPPPEQKLPNTGAESDVLAAAGIGTAGAGAALMEVSRRLKRSGGEGAPAGSGLFRPNGDEYPSSFAQSTFAKGVGENDKSNLEKAYFGWMRKDSEGRAYAKAQLAAKLAEVTALTDVLTSSDDDDNLAQAA